MKKRTFTPISVLIGVLLLALAAAMTTFVADSDIAHAQTSPDATLSGLQLFAANTTTDLLSPTFDTDNLPTDNTFTARITYASTGVVVTPAAAQYSDNNDPSDDSIIRVNGSTVTSGTGKEIDLSSAAGRTTTITIQVTAPNRIATKTYKIKVYRERQTKIDNNNLATLSVSGASLSPSFSSGTTAYTARTTSDKVTVSYSLSDTGGGASVGDRTASVTAGQGSASIDLATNEVTLGSEASTTRITVPVTAEDASTQNYTIDVYHIRDNRAINATLSSLSLAAVGTGAERVGSALQLDTNHDDGTITSYREVMDNDTDSVTVEAAAADAGATYVVTPSDQDGETQGHQVLLTARATTTITVRVTAEDTNVTKTYTVKVYKQGAAPLSQVNTLDSLSVGTPLSPAFNKAVTSYKAQVAHNVGKVTLRYTPTDNTGGAGVVVSAADNGNELTVVDDVVTLAGKGQTSTITLTVTPENGNPTKNYEIEVYRLRSLPSANASLSGFSFDPNLTGIATFAAGTKDYSGYVLNDTESVNVTATAFDANNGATVRILPADADTSTAAHEVRLTAGAVTTVRMTVTAEDKTSTDTYTVKIYRQRSTLSKVNTLSALSLSDGTLSPTFMSDGTDYTARVANSVGKVTVSATPTDNAGGAVVVVAKTGTCGTSDIASGLVAAKGEVTLNAGGTNTDICVQVTPETRQNTDRKAYKISVYRERTNLSEDASLKTFTIKEATGSLSSTTDIDPVTTGTQAGNAALNVLNKATQHVIYRVRAVTVETTADLGAIVEIIPADSDNAKAGHQVNLDAGAATDITVTVQAEDSAVPAKEHKLSVYRRNVPGSESDDATLKSLSLSDAILTPEFDPATTKYTAAAAFSAAKTTVTAEANHIGANVVIMPTPDSKKEISLYGGGTVTIITVAVTAEDGTTKTYTVDATRAAEAGTDATLSSLSLTDGAGMDIALTPAFDAATAAYTASVDSTVTAASVMAMAAAPGTTVEVMYGADDTEVTAGDDGSYSVPLTEGANTVKVMVTAEDAETTMTYTVGITVSPSDPSLALYDEYDTDDNNMIDKSEVVAAIEAYLQHGTLTKAEVVTLIQKYLSGEPIRE